MFERICTSAPWCPPAVFEATLELAAEIAREGREGRRIGTLFTVGRADQVLESSRALILDPIACHPQSVRNVTDPNLRGTMKELAQLDGAFVIDENGVVVAACRYLDSSTEGIDIGLGLGSRHLAAASISKKTGAIAIVVSESAIVRVFLNGSICAELLPELWLFSRRSLQLKGPIHQEHIRDLAVITPEDGSR